MKALLPETFDITNHFTSHPPGLGSKTFNLDHAKYILSQITLVPIRNKDVADRMENGYTPLCSNKLKETVNDYKRYLDYFKNTGVIESNHSYQTTNKGVLGKCKGYRFVKQHLHSAQTPVDYSPEFEKHLIKRRKADYQKLKKEYGHLTKWLYPNCQLRVDVHKATEFLEKRRAAQLLIPALLDKKKPTGYSFKQQAKGQNKDPDVQFRYAMVGMDCLQNGDIGCTVDETVGRMHTVLTNLKSDLRNLIAYGSEPLVSIDITNSQPYLATVLTKPRFYRKSAVATGRYTPLTLENLAKDQDRQLYSLMSVNLRQLIDNKDFNLYNNLVSNVGGGSMNTAGQVLDLYSFMQQECTKYKITFTSRAEVKEGVFEMLFSRNGNNTKAKKLFKTCFRRLTSYSEL